MSPGWTKACFPEEGRLMGGFTKVAETKNLPPGKAMSVEVEGRRLALFNVDGTFYAIGGVCTHRGGPLSEGDLEGTVITCPLHGAQFDVTSGEVVNPPAPQGVPSYRVQVDGDEI